MNKCIDCNKKIDSGYERCYSCNENFRIDNFEGFEDDLENDLNFRVQLAKGKLAEVLIEQLFSALWFSVHKYGMENTLPAYIDSFYESTDETARRIRMMPDFIIVDTEGRTFYLEVKFRKNGILKYEDLGVNYPYQSGLVVLVTSRGIKGITVKELNTKGIFKSEEKYSIFSLPCFESEELDFDDYKDVFERFNNMAISVFKEL